MPPSLHSELGASSAARWINCPASVRLSRLAQEILERKADSSSLKASIYANEGSVAHSVCEALLLGTYEESQWLGKVVKYGGDDILVTQEMVSAAKEYADIIHAVVPSNVPLQIERRFSLDWINPSMFGTCDCAALGSDTLWIFDFKYGKGVPVSAIDNPQLLYYALGVLGKEPPKSLRTVSMMIVQPRVDKGVSIFNITVDSLYAWAEQTLIPAVKRAMDPDAPCVAGEVQCRWCKGYSLCPVQKTAVKNVVSDYFPELSGKTLDKIDESVIDFVLPSPESLSTERLEKLAALYLSRLESFFTGCCEELKARMIEGNVNALEKISLQPKKKREIWVDNDKAEALLCELLGDNAYEKKLISPSKAKKLVDKETISAYISVPESNEFNLKLIKE